MSLINVALLYGGKSGEHEISLISSASVLAQLDATKYNIIPVGIDKNGLCYLNQYQDLLAYPKALPVKTKHSQQIDNLFVSGHFALKAMSSFQWFMVLYMKMAAYKVYLN